MAITPKRALAISQTVLEPVAFIDFGQDPTGGIWLGYPFKWRLQLDITALLNSGATPDFEYDATNIEVGDWISTSARGVAVQIIELVEVVDKNQVIVIAEDIDLYNILNDTSFSGQGIGPDGHGLVFPVDEVSNLPILGPVDAYSTDLNAQMDLFARFIQQKQLKAGGQDILGIPTDGTFDDGAIKGWETGKTSFTDAIDQLNRYVLKTSPTKPADVSSATIRFTNESPFSMGDVLLANGSHTVNTPGLFPYLTPLAGIGELRTTTVPISDVGSGDSGTLTAKVNGISVGSVNLTSGSDIGAYDSLEILDDYVYPRGTNSFWTALEFQANSAIPDGINLFEFEHSITGKASRYLITENMFDAPEITDYTVAVSSSNILYSSGVPHLTRDSTLKFSMTASNLAGRTFPMTESMALRTIPDIGSTLINHDHPQFPTVIAVNNGPITVTDETLTLTADNVSTQAVIRFTARNSFVESFAEPSITINYIGGTHGDTEIYEGNETLKRVALPDGDTPVVNTISFDTAWNSGNENSLGDLALWEAPIIGARALQTRLNYSDFIPPGPDFSNKSEIQYITFMVQGITNRIKLSIIGQYSGMWIKLPGIDNDMPNATNGWWNATKQADFAPTLWPGHALASDGCLLDTVGGITSYTFGSVSSAKSIDNLVLIRFALAADDFIEAMQVL
jgi:hypothetical protein